MDEITRTFLEEKLARLRKQWPRLCCFCFCELTVDQIARWRLFCCEEHRQSGHSFAGVESAMPEIAGFRDA